MPMNLLICFLLAAGVTANQQDPFFQYVQTPVQVVPVLSQPPQNAPIPPKYVPVQQPESQLVYVPVLNFDVHPDKQPGVQGPSPPQQTVGGQPNPHPIQHHSPYNPNHSYQIPLHHHDGHHDVNHVLHSPPPAPHPSSGTYEATLSYGPGYPTVVYHCWLPGHQPPQNIHSSHVVQGPNGHTCAVSYHKSSNNHGNVEPDHTKYPDVSHIFGQPPFVAISPNGSPVNDVRYS